MKLKIFTLCLLIAAKCCWSQCTLTAINGDYVVSSSIILSGTYNVSGRFIIPSGITVFVNKYANNTCGKLEINAKTVIVNGTIDANDAGQTGGIGGVGGSSVTSLTGDQVSLTSCNNKDNTGQITLEGGKAGLNGFGMGAGLAGANGSSGSGPKQQCLSNNDEAGMIGSAGGGGGGSGGSYGGKGSSGGAGGNGTNSYTATGVNVSTGYAVVQGNGGAGAIAGNTYGTAGSNDIDLGSGGGGAGGGARSFNIGNNGAKGGNGGGLVKISAQDTLIISGSILVNGSNGGNGGSGGNGNATAKCCSDGCDDCGEATLSCGAGSGAGSGGGSGGGILLECYNFININGSLNAKGGNGGLGGQAGTGITCNYSALLCGTQTLKSGDGATGNSGGAGGGGRIKIFAASCQGNTISPVTNVTGGTGFANGLPGTYSVICNFNTSLSEYTKYHELSIFPNPTHDFLNIKFKYPQYLNDHSGKIIVSDINGKEVFVTDCMLSKVDQQVINLSHLNNGVYFLKLISSDVTVMQKLIKN